MKFGPGHLVVSEIFDSLQGEGFSLGRPATFLRLGHCNLACTWCDTKYTWDWQHHDMQAELRTVPCSALAADLGARKAGLLVVTGGEPLLQTEALVALLPAIEREVEVEVETAGTLSPDPLLPHVTRWNVSPKLASSGNPLAKRHVAHVLARFAELEHAHFKLVVGSADDATEAVALVRELGIPPGRVWLMPEATDRAALQEGAAALAPLCETHGFHLGYRLHVALWGDQRGV